VQDHTSEADARIIVDKARWICAVTKKLNGDGFLITTYPTDRIKEGKRIWHR